MRIFFSFNLKLICSCEFFKSLKLHSPNLQLRVFQKSEIALANENGAVLLRIRLSSTLQRRKRSPKTEPFENALQSGAIWKRCFLKTLFSSVDGDNDAIWKRWRHQNHSTVSIQNGGQTLPCSFNFAPISRADILKCACLEFIWPCALRV